jgi:hypothetical protein
VYANSLKGKSEVYSNNILEGKSDVYANSLEGKSEVVMSRFS